MKEHEKYGGRGGWSGKDRLRSRWIREADERAEAEEWASGRRRAGSETNTRRSGRQVVKRKRHGLQPERPKRWLGPEVIPAGTLSVNGRSCWISPAVDGELAKLRVSIRGSLGTLSVSAPLERGRVAVKFNDQELACNAWLGFGIAATPTSGELEVVVIGEPGSGSLEIWPAMPNNGADRYFFDVV